MIFGHFLLFFLIPATATFSQSQYQLPKITVQGQSSGDSFKQRVSSNEQSNWGINNDSKAIDLLTNGTIQQGYPESIIIQGAKHQYSSFFIDDFQLYDHSNNSGALSVLYLSPIENSGICIDTTNSDHTSGSLGGKVQLSNDAPEYNTSQYEVEMGTFDTHSHRLYHYQMSNFTKLQVSFNTLQSRGLRDIPLSRRTNFLMNRRTPTLNLGGMVKLETNSPSSDWHLACVNHQQNQSQNYKELGLTNNIERRNQSLFYLHGLSLKRNSLQHKWNPEFSVGIQGINRKHQSLHAPFIPSDRYSSQTTELNWNNIFKVNKKNILNIGTKLSNDRFSMLNQSYQMGGNSVSKIRQQIYLGHQYSPFKKTTFQSKIMGNHRSNTAWFPTLSLGCSQKFVQTNTKIGLFYHLISHLPSLYQLHDKQYGNSNLRSEKGHKVELKLDQKIDSSHKITASIYKTNIRNAITFIPNGGDFFSGQYRNASKLSSYGIENTIRFNITKSAHLITNQNFCISKDQNNLQQIRIPQYKVSVGVRYAINETTSSSVMYTHYGKTPDFQRFPPYTKLYVGGRGLMRGTISRIINENVKIFGRIENMLNRKNEAPLGYMQPGQAFYAGLTIKS